MFFTATSWPLIVDAKQLTETHLQSTRSVSRVGEEDDDPAELHEADALLIQSVWRGYKTRKAFRNLKGEKRLEYLMSQGAPAIRIQSWYKGAAVRKHLRQIGV